MRTDCVWLFTRFLLVSVYRTNSTVSDYKSIIADYLPSSTANRGRLHQQYGRSRRSTAATPLPTSRLEGARNAPWERPVASRALRATMPAPRWLMRGPGL